VVQMVWTAISSGLIFREHGVFLIASCILWTETDEPGRYIIKGKKKTMLEFAQHIARFAQQNRYNRTPTKQVVNVLLRCCQDAVIEVLNDGTIQCPHILKQLELSKKRAEAGKQSTTHFVQQNEPICSTQNQNQSKKKSIKTLLLRSRYKRAKE
jgi:hypothetical protein